MAKYIRKKKKKKLASIVHPERNICASNASSVESDMRSFPLDEF